MAAYGEGLNILAHADAGTAGRDADAETAPFRDAEFYRYDIDTAKITELWRRGSVVSSWLLDLTAQALRADPGLSEFGGRVSDSGEGRWTLQAAIDVGVPVDVLAAALFDRFSSQGQGDVAHRVLSAMRKGFGGHAERSRLRGRRGGDAQAPGPAGDRHLRSGRATSPSGSSCPRSTTCTRRACCRTASRWSGTRARR
jgi:6-phosphogluconate dehydrogenase